MIYLNADREPAAIAATTVHELQHGKGGDRDFGPRSEPCATNRELSFISRSATEIRLAAQGDKRYRNPDMKYDTDPRLNCGF